MKLFGLFFCVSLIFNKFLTKIKYDLCDRESIERTNDRPNEQIQMKIEKRKFKIKVHAH